MSPAGWERAEITLHGHRFTYRSAGDGALVTLLHGIAGSSATWEDVIGALAAPSGWSLRTSSVTAIRQAARRLLAGRLRERGARSVRGARLRARDGRRALARRWGCDAVRLPVPGALRAPRPGLERRTRSRGPPAAAGGGAAGCRSRATLALDRGTAWHRLVRARARRSGSVPAPTSRRSGAASRRWRSATRAAFVHTVRGIIDVGGQRVSAADRLYLAAELPTLIVWGARDPLIPVRHAHEAHERIPGSRLEIFPDAGHFPYLDDPGASRRCCSTSSRRRPRTPSTRIAGSGGCGIGVA